jgi:hypothetical protein
MVVIAITLACLATAVFFFHSNGKHSQHATASSKKSQRRVSSHNRYRAASIIPGGCACAEATSLGDKRFLLDQTPRMPLRECDAAKCACRYVRHEDRRVRDDRRSPFCLQTDLHRVAGKSEHRITGYCRRSSDSTSSAAASDFEYKDMKWAH